MLNNTIEYRTYLPKKLSKIDKTVNLEEELNKPEEELGFKTSLDLNLALLGTIIGGKALAFISNLDSGKDKLYGLNEEVSGARVVSIKPRRAVLKKDGLVQELLLKFDRDVSEIDSPGDGQLVITAISADTMKVNKPGMVKQLNKANEWLSKIKILPVPEKDSDKLKGFSIDNVPPGSIIEQAGIKSRDVIYSVSGYRLESVRAALDVFSKIRNQSNIKVYLLRDGEPVTLSYEINER